MTTKPPIVHQWPPTQRPFLTQPQQNWLRSRDIVVPWRSVLVWREGLIEVYTVKPRRTGLVRFEVSPEYAERIARVVEEYHQGVALVSATRA